MLQHGRTPEAAQWVGESSHETLSGLLHSDETLHIPTVLSGWPGPQSVMLQMGGWRPSMPEVTWRALLPCNYRLCEVPGRPSACTESDCLGLGGWGETAKEYKVSF